MPHEKRDKHSKARLFIPTQSEKTLVNSQRQLNESIEELDAMKAELQKILDEAKKK
jgi:hypothetical protein